MRFVARLMFFKCDLGINYWGSFPIPMHCIFNDGILNRGCNN